MTKRRRPKKREPWPAFTLLTAVLTVAAVLAGLLLDYISAQRGETAFLFTAAPKARGRGRRKAASGEAGRTAR